MTNTNSKKKIDFSNSSNVTLYNKMTKTINSKNDLKINNDTLYNKMTKTKKTTTPFICSKCGKGCFTVPNCASCIMDSGFIEDSIFASNNDIKYNKGKTIEEQHKEIKTEKKKNDY